MLKRKLPKLERYFTETPDANVNVNLKITIKIKHQKLKLRFQCHNLVLRAEETNVDMYAGIDLITDKLERQIRKHKTKVNRKFREKGDYPCYNLHY